MDLKTLQELEAESLDQVVYLGFTRRQLQDAFSRVEDKEHWKFPIDATFDAQTITVAELNVISAAIVFYTGGEATIVRTGTEVKITAPGYYASVGA